MFVIYFILTYRQFHLDDWEFSKTWWMDVLGELVCFVRLEKAPPLSHLRYYNKISPCSPKIRRPWEFSALQPNKTHANRQNTIIKKKKTSTWWRWKLGWKISLLHQSKEGWLVYQLSIFGCSSFCSTFLFMVMFLLCSMFLKSTWLFSLLQHCFVNADCVIKLVKLFS